MATAGSGDALSGIIAGLLAQGYSPEMAAIVGVFVHGMAGDAAAEQKGKIGMLAGDLIEALPEAWKKVE
jgi:NAD(P)H-hydrate epimerase